jgi:thiosulfate dehydrogenase (quinone) large subunit
VIPLRQSPGASEPWRTESEPLKRTSAVSARRQLLSQVNDCLSDARQSEMPESECLSTVEESAMVDSHAERNLVLVFRLLMAWTFIYAASHQAFTDFSVVGFLKSTKTFHDLFAVFTAPAIAPIVSFLVAWGHLLIGLSLLFGMMVRVSAVCGIALLLMYWMAHMDFPYIENKNNFLIDYHIVYSVVLIYLFVKRAGHVWGLDAWAENLDFVREHPTLRPLVA